MKRLLASLACRLLEHRPELLHAAVNKLWDGRWGASATVQCKRCGRTWYL